MSNDPLALIARLRPHWQVLEARPLSGGYSNQSHWLRTAEHGSFVLRQPHPDNPFAIDRRAEARIAQWAAASGLGPVVEYFDVQSGVQITAAEAGTPVGDLPRTRWPDPATIGTLLRDLHDGPGAPDAGIALPASLGVWRARCEQLGRFIPPARSAPAPRTLRLCHRDLNPWNVLLGSDGGLTLVDWELAGPADPRFDLANAILLFEFDADECQRFLAAAGQEDSSLEELGPWIDLVREREYLWAELALAAGIEASGIRAQRDTRRLELWGA